MEIAHLKMWQKLLLTQHPFSLIFSACFSPTHKAFSLQSGQGGVREVTRRPLQSVVKGHAPPPLAASLGILWHRDEEHVLEVTEGGWVPHNVPELPVQPEKTCLWASFETNE